MKFVCPIILLSLLAVVSSSDDENCVWKYKCCVFKETNGEVTCEEMCEAEIICKTPEATKLEVSSEAEEFDPYAPIELKAKACREGYQYRIGRCRKIMKQRKQD